MDSPAVPTIENAATVLGRKVRRLVLLDRAREMLGGATKLGEALGIGRRAVNHKLVAERGLSDGEIGAVAAALDARAEQLRQLAADMRALTA